MDRRVRQGAADRVEERLVPAPGDRPLRRARPARGTTAGLPRPGHGQPDTPSRPARCQRRPRRASCGAVAARRRRSGRIAGRRPVVAAGRLGGRRRAASSRVHPGLLCASTVTWPRCRRSRRGDAQAPSAQVTASSRTAARYRSMTRRLATASSGGVGVGCRRGSPRRTRSASTAYGSAVSNVEDLDRRARPAGRRRRRPARGSAGRAGC